MLRWRTAAIITACRILPVTMIYSHPVVDADKIARVVDMIATRGYAVAPEFLDRAGAGYARHIDRFRDDDTRVLSIVLYLNDRWRNEDGGMLRLHLERGRSIDAIPYEGTLVAFLSDRFAHEVLPARRERFSIAGWF